MDKKKDPIAWAATAHELWKSAITQKADTMYEDEPVLHEETKLTLEAAMEVEPPLPWVVIRESDVSKKLQSKIPMSSPHDFLIVAQDGTVVGRVAGHLDDAANLVAHSGQVLCDVAINVHDAMETVLNSFTELQEFYLEETEGDDGLDDYEDKYDKALDWIRCFVAANNSFSPMEEVNNGRGELVTELYHPDTEHPESGIQWGVWETIDPDLNFKFWVGGFRIIEDGEATQGELIAHPQAEMEESNKDIMDFVTQGQMRKMVAQMSMAIQLEIGVPIDARFENWIETGEVDPLM